MRITDISSFAAFGAIFAIHIAVIVVYVAVNAKRLSARSLWLFARLLFNTVLAAAIWFLYLIYYGDQWKLSNADKPALKRPIPTTPHVTRDTRADMAAPHRPLDGSPPRPARLQVQPKNNASPAEQWWEDQDDSP